MLALPLALSLALRRSLQAVVSDVAGETCKNDVGLLLDSLERDCRPASGKVKVPYIEVGRKTRPNWPIGARHLSPGRRLRLREGEGDEGVSEFFFGEFRMAARGDDQVLLAGGTEAIGT